MRKSFSCLLLAAAVLLTGACSHEVQNGPVGRQVEVKVTFTTGQLALSRGFADTAPSVDRVLLLPFSMIDASGGDSPGNFTPNFGLAKQIDVSRFPVEASLSLIEGVAYKVMAIGYNRADYNYDTPAALKNRFTLSANPSTLGGMRVTPKSPAAMGDFFSCVCTIADSELFTASRQATLSGELRRLVSGLSLQLTNVTGDVTSVELRAGRLVNYFSPVDGGPGAWQSGEFIDDNLLGSAAPDVSGNVSFDVFLLPTSSPDFETSAPATKFYLDIYLGSTPQPVRHEVQVEDTPGVAASNAITLQRRGLVVLSGDYASIDAGFTVGSSLDLDSDDWDGPS